MKAFNTRLDPCAMTAGWKEKGRWSVVTTPGCSYLEFSLYYQNNTWRSSSRPSLLSLNRCRHFSRRLENSVRPEIPFSTFPSELKGSDRVTSALQSDRVSQVLASDGGAASPCQVRQSQSPAWARSAPGSPAWHLLDFAHHKAGGRE